MNITEHPLPGHGTRTPWGIMLHTTGDGPPKHAHANGTEPLQEAIEAYERMPEGPGYVIGPDGSVVRLRADEVHTWHCGVSPTERRDFLSGHWTALAGTDLAGWWRQRWPGVPSPQHLYPSESPNTDYIGIEMVPCGTYVAGNSGSWTPLWGKPIGGPRGRFTGAQYTAAALLCLTLCRAHGIPSRARGRVVGHEDVNPLRRPGWDPGDRRAYWDWNTFWGILDGLEKNL